MKPPPKISVLSLLFLALLYMVTGVVFYLALSRNYRPETAYEPLRLVMLLLFLPILLKFAVQLTCAPLYSLRELFRGRRTGSMPLVSVLIPAWNEEVGILKTIHSVLDSGYSNLQVLVINDGSTDGTHEKVTRFMAEFGTQASPGLSVKYLRLENGGKAKALNRALKQADGEIIVTIDADSVMGAGAISKMVKRFDDPKVGAVAGNVIVGNKRKPIELMQQLEYVYGFFFKRADSLLNSVYIIGGAAAAYRKEVLDQLGGFDHDIITEDIEMSTRILAHGYKTRYAADAVIYTEGPSDFKSLCNQRLRWKYGRILTFIKHRRLFFSLSKQHSSYLSWILLPIAVYAEFLLLIEAFMLSLFFIYTVHTSDYMPLVFVILLLSSVICGQVLFDPKARFHSNLFFLAPVAWLVFYVMDLVEFQALVRSIKRMVKHEDLKWQKWVRVGVLNDAPNVASSLSLPEMANRLS